MDLNDTSLINGICPVFGTVILINFKTNKQTAMKKDTRKPIEIDADTIVLTEGEKTSMLVKILSERSLKVVESDHEDGSLSKDEIISEIKKLSSEDQNELIVSVSKDILMSRIVKMKYLESVISEAQQDSNAILLSAKVLQEGLSASAITVG